MSKAKKQRIVYKEDAKSKAADLEEFLFGAGGEPAAIFEREKEECEETVAELVQQATRRGGLLHDSDLFFEDTRGGASGSSSNSDDEEEEDDEEADEEGAGGKGCGARRGSRVRLRPARGASGDEHDRDGDADDAGGDEDDGSESEEEEEEDGQGDPEPSGGSGEEVQDEDGDEGGAARGEAGGRAAAAAADVGGVGGRGASTAAAAKGKQQGGTGGGGGGGGGVNAARAPVWSDPDDAAVRVDVATGPNRLRKLRSNDKQKSMEGPEYEAALRKQHQALNPRTSWAKKRRQEAAAAGRAAGGNGEDDDEAEAEALLASAGGLMDRPAGRRLPPGQIETTRLKDANAHQPSEAVVQAVRFHPNGQVLLTAGLDKKLRLFQVDGLRNPLVQSVHLDDMPITHAAFAAVAGQGDDAAAAAAAADRVVLSGRRPHFYVYDMGAARVERVLGPVGCPLRSLERFAVSPPSASASGSETLVAFTGDGGFIPLVSLRSRQWVANLKMSGNVRALTFSRDGSELLSTGDDGVVHIWDLRTRRCRLAFNDAGNIGDASSLALSPDQRFLATGAKSGVVNVYRRADVEAAAAASSSGGSGRVSVKPARELMNLTTDVDSLVFSPDSQMLAMASRMKRDALRLVHLPSLTVFANWPTGRSPLHYVHSADFSPHCGLLAIGNAKGRALLYRLHHYQQA